MKRRLIRGDVWIKNGDLNLHCLDWGNEVATPMLLVHGLCCEAHYWDLFAEAMRNDYHVIAIDLRGHGDSSWADDYSFEQYVADLNCVVETLKIKNMVLIGHSLGAIVVILYAARHTDILKRLVVVDNGPEINSAFLMQVRNNLAGIPLSYSSEEEALLQIGLESPYYSEDYKRLILKTALKRDSSGKLTVKYDPRLRSTELSSLNWLWQYMKKISCPILVVHGVESDLLLSSGARKMKEILTNVTLADIEHAGHFVMGDNPEAFEKAVRDFLNSDILRLKSDKV